MKMSAQGQGRLARARLLAFLSAPLAVVTLSACAPNGVGAGPTQATSVATAPVRPSTVNLANSACAALMQQTVPGLTAVKLTQASLIAAGSQRARDPNGNREVGEPLPEHCLVRGRIDERVGSDGKPYHTGFELRLPSQFSGRFIYQGGGGNDGVVFNAVGRTTGAAGWADNALQRGFAAVSTDAGHQSPSPEFGLDPQARIEHAHRAHERTARTAKALLAHYYGRGADRSYFVGCSGGGRQGMMFTQRYPDLFDGVVAVAPAMRVSEGATIAAAWTVQRFMSVAPKGGDGQPVLALASSEGQLKRVAAEVLDQCDARDGLKDGLVSDYEGCRISPQKLVCAAGTAPGTDCLSPAQAQALGDMMAGPRNSRGALYFGWPWDAGLADPSWRAWTLGTATQGPANARHITLMAGALGHEFVTPPDTTLSTLNFNFETDPARMKAFHQVYDTADDANLMGMRARGGKLLLIHGMADPIFSALETMDYQRRVNAAVPQASQHVRSFMVPGMTHCAGGPATGMFDGLAAMQRWVEDGAAPARIEAKGSSLMAGVSRPLCPYPQVARYVSGDSQLASSFACR